MVAMVGCGKSSAPGTGAGSQVGSGAAPAARPAGFPLVAARAAVKTTIFGTADATKPEPPPKDVFTLTHYRSGPGELAAYETPTAPGARRPAMIWIAGGFDWGIGAGSWEPAEPSNDQSAAALRPPGLVLMVPALRGASGNPGKPECFLGEVDDILAARDHLAQRADVDPARIYLGGHSTGGTLALLAAASTDKFRAVFALGPVADARQYGPSGCLPEGKPEDEYVARAPVEWIHTVVTPTFVIEGANGNAAVLPILKERASPAVTLLTIAGANHFSAIRPASDAIARAILADTGARPAITLDAAAIAAAVAR